MGCALQCNGCLFSGIFWVEGSVSWGLQASTTVPDQHQAVFLVHCGTDLCMSTQQAELATQQETGANSLIALSDLRNLIL